MYALPEISYTSRDSISSQQVFITTSNIASSQSIPDITSQSEHINIIDNDNVSNSTIIDGIKYLYTYIQVM